MEINKNRYLNLNNKFNADEHHDTKKCTVYIECGFDTNAEIDEYIWFFFFLVVAHNRRVKVNDGLESNTKWKKEFCFCCYLFHWNKCFICTPQKTEIHPKNATFHSEQPNGKQKWEEKKKTFLNL